LHMSPGWAACPLSRLRERVPERSEGGRGQASGRYQPSPGSRHSASQTRVNALVALATLSRKRERGSKQAAQLWVNLARKRL